MTTLKSVNKIPTLYFYRQYQKTNKRWVIMARAKNKTCVYLNCFSLTQATQKAGQCNRDFLQSGWEMFDELKPILL